PPPGQAASCASCSPSREKLQCHRHGRRRLGRIRPRMGAERTSSFATCRFGNRITTPSRTAPASRAASSPPWSGAPRNCAWTARRGSPACGSGAAISPIPRRRPTCPTAKPAGSYRARWPACAAPDFGEALRVGVRHAPATGALLDLAIDDDDPDGLAVTMRMRTREPAIEAYLCEELVSSCLNLCRAMLGPRFRAARIELGYPPPAYAERYARVFDAPVRFGCADTRVAIAREWLAMPMPAANPDTLRQIVALCRAQMPSEQPPAGIVSAIERRLALQLAQNPRLTDLAAELHLTERTLRRQLRAAGTSFRVLHDQVRERS